MRILISLLILLGISEHSLAQKTEYKYINASELTIVGKAKETNNIFHRIDKVQSIDMPKAVQALALNSAGIAFLFETNSPIISAKWTLAEKKHLANMTPIAHSGLDLYGWKDGNWQFVGVAKPEESENQNAIIISNMDTTMKQFMLYMPLYNTITKLEVGVSQQAKINPPLKPMLNLKKRVVIYGSSVVQGASASRPGMAYPSIIQRELGYDVINLGFSGNAKMEIELAKYLSTVQADCYILDCIPNPSPQQIKERAYPFIKYLREHQKNTPIILVETIIRENGYWDSKIGQNVKNQNEEIRKAYHQLTTEGMKDLYYIKAAELSGDDHEATIDGIHLTDLGFKRISEAILPVLKKALKKKN